MGTLSTDQALRRSWRDTWSRLFGRFRHGLFIQEILDRLARAGLVIYPYFVYVEAPCSASAAEPPPELVARLLAPHDADAMMRLDPRMPRGPYLARLSKAECLGLFAGAELVGYSWCKLDTVPIPGSFGASLFGLRSNEAYLFDIFVGRSYRGRRLAELLRSLAHSGLSLRGITRLYSHTLAFNRSPRRLLARDGVYPLELRVFMGMRFKSLIGLDARLWRRAAILPTARLSGVVTSRRTGVDG